MKLIGLTGGIGSGKSTVAQLLVDRGFPVVDADKLAREVVEPGQPALAKLAEAFGGDVVKQDGTLDRQLLAQRAFVDREKTDLLNQITHPAIDDLTKKRFAEAERDGAQAVIYDMPLLVDLGMHEDMDLTVVVAADEDVRVERLSASRGIDPEDARRRMSAQVSDETRKAAADVVIDNNGDVEDLAPQVDRLVETIRSLG